MEATGYRSMKTLGGVTTFLLAGNAGLACLGLLLNVWLRQGELQLHAEDFESDGGSLLAAIALVGTLSIGIYVGTIVAFCMFVHRATANLTALGRRGMQFTPGWAVGWYFVPFANLVKPYQSMKEIVQASEANVDRDGYSTDWMTHHVPQIVVGWWAFWIMRMFADRISSRMEVPFAFDVFACVLELVTVTLAILVVQLVVRRQEALAGVDHQVSIAREMGHVADRR